MPVQPMAHSTSSPQMGVKQVLALDLGASSGRAVLGRYDGERVTIHEIRRFGNDAVNIHGTLYWDVLRLFHEIKASMVEATQTYGPIDSLAVDTWGVDFGLLNAQGELIANPVHYRDNRTEGMAELVFATLSKEALYTLTGNQIMPLNTLFQLVAIQQKQPHVLTQTQRLLFMPDLLNYFLTGKQVTEQTIASTSQLYDVSHKQWATALREQLDLPDILGELVPPGTVIGTTTDLLSRELGIPPMDVIAVCSHDTQSAIMAVPADNDPFIYLSCGTWSLLGTEVSSPILSQKAIDHNITNEVGYDNRISFLKNITGLFILNQCKAQWDREGQVYTYAQLSALAADCGDFSSRIDPEDPVFAQIGNMPQHIRDYCQRTNQVVPSTMGHYVRCIYESLALAYKKALADIEDCTGQTYPVIYMVGGGSRSALFCQIIADTTGRQVSAGPVEATVLGNILLQLMSKGHIADLAHARQIVKRSETIHIYS